MVGQGEQAGNVSAWAMASRIRQTLEGGDNPAEVVAPAIQWNHADEAWNALRSGALDEAHSFGGPAGGQGLQQGVQPRSSGGPLRSQPRGALLKEGPVHPPGKAAPPQFLGSSVAGGNPPGRVEGYHGCGQVPQQGLRSLAETLCVFCPAANPGGENPAQGQGRPQTESGTHKQQIETVHIVPPQAAGPPRQRREPGNAKAHR